MELPKLGRTISINHTNIDKEKDGGYDDKLVKDDRTFFCSELVGKALKLMGIIKNNKESCCQFLPKHFSS